ncbi:MAG: exonuclease domain-containing protein [Desulfobacterales bacterium]
MNRSNTFTWFVVGSIGFTLLVILSLTVIFWQQLPAGDRAYLIELGRQNLGFLFSAAVLLLAGFGFALDWLFRLYILPIDKIASETRLIHSVNPTHRIHIEGVRDIVRLANVINESADRYEDLYNQVQKKIDSARATAEEEKNILAAIVAELPEGVLICNTEGQILLYNTRVTQLLIGAAENGSVESAPDSGSGRFIGLGRSVFGLIDKHLIVHALGEIAGKLERKESDVVAYFVVFGQERRLLRVEAVPILNHRREFTGFILIFHDITQQLETEKQLDTLLRSLSRSTRSSLASIRAAIEAILDYPGMDSRQLQKFKEIIHQESIAIGKVIDKTTSYYSHQSQTRYPLVRMPAGEVIAAVVGKTREKLGLAVQIETGDVDVWIQVDSYSIVAALLFVQERLRTETGCDTFSCRVLREGHFACLDFMWTGRPIRMETIRKWQDQPVAVAGEVLSSTLREVIGHHRAEIWSHSLGPGRQAYLRFLFPATDTADVEHIRNLTILSKSRPEFFDFDLFSQPGQVPELDNRKLTELTYTVFDTETTGLDPKGGDEIISIGAVRVVNNRLLHTEFFDQLVDPQREISPQSIGIHGIQPQMLINQPTIERVLPLFHQFADETILVAHNAAFDMRMLQLKEAAAGVKFANPVLDTLLLSAVVHPGHKNHDMEQIAERLGVSIVGRHTALGDAIATGEIFLKLIPLLESQGITTLKQARSASRKSYYARLKY